MTSPHRIATTSGLALSLLLAAACAGGQTTTTAGSPSTTATPTTTAARAGTSAATPTSMAKATTTSSTAATTTTTGATTGASSSASGGTAGGLQQGTWGDNVTVTFADGYLTFTSNGLPNHARAAQYAVPAGAGGGAMGGGGAGVPTEATSKAMADPSRAQTYSFTITTNPTKAATTTPAGGGTIGVMISGAALFNPYEADGTTVALMSNFTVKNANGEDVAFLDTCNGHPNQMGAYHYHGLPSCVTATVDEEGGPSHVIGVAFDGFPIYGDRDIDGNVITASQLDECNGITSPTPEFPEGIYHYVLLDTPDATSSIRCFSGTVDSSLTHARMGPAHD